jgi:Domain of Unknown Function with PDB structure (DUF3857)
VNLSGGSLSHLWRISTYRGIGFSPCSARRVLIAAVFVFAFCCSEKVVDKVNAQEPKPESKQAVPSKPAETEKNAAQIELLETKYRFETSGDSRKEVHTRVRINNELGVRQFGRLNFDFNRSFQAVEIPLVRITHASGGTADILPSAITDNPNPAAVDAPAYQNVRIKSVRILGLQPGDVLEYRVITTTSHHPLAPDFWLDHSFDRTGIVSHEVFEIDVPPSAKANLQINPETPPHLTSSLGTSAEERIQYQWTWSQAKNTSSDSKPTPEKPDVTLTTFASWDQLAARLGAFLMPSEDDCRRLRDKATSLVGGDSNSDARMSDIYDFVSQKIRTVDLPTGTTGFQSRNPAETMASGYGTAEDKFLLFAALGNNFFGPARLGLVSSTGNVSATDLPSPAGFDHLLAMSGYPSISFWMDLNLEIAPFRMIAAKFHRRPVFVIGPAVENRWEIVLDSFPSRSQQTVTVNGAIDQAGSLSAKVSYAIRGDNELVLRLAFHQTPKEKWKDVAQLLAISDGFRGQITNVTASDPYQTKEPFSVEYEISQPKFVDWSKRPVRIPALLPQPGLPEAPSPSAGTPANSVEKKSIDLGTPLEIELDATVQLPKGTEAQAPTGTTVERDYATFSSKYSAPGNTVRATRKLHFISREIPTTRAGDLNAFLRAVQTDQTQLFALQRSNTAVK